MTHAMKPKQTITEEHAK